jgi:pSer/pThr/pTyr-binding forkhead associated (FHA) protein
MIIGGPVAEPSFAWLVVVEGAGNNPLLGRPLSLKSSGTTTIGRVPGNDIVIADPACSSQHVRVRQEAGEEGKQIFVIYDLASANGLYIGAKADYKDDKSRAYRHVLKDGDYILIGETTLVFKQV